jgi:hypothetical protein
MKTCEMALEPAPPIREYTSEDACCGHGNIRMAYIQYWTKPRIAGKSAIKEQKRLLRL